MLARCTRPRPLAEGETKKTACGELAVVRYAGTNGRPDFFRCADHDREDAPILRHTRQFTELDAGVTSAAAPATGGAA